MKYWVKLGKKCVWMWVTELDVRILVPFCRRFELKNLAQIKQIYPLAFVFRNERVPEYGSSHQDYQLTIECNLERNSSSIFSQFKFLCPTNLVQRRKVFTRNLLAVVKSHHSKFLAQLKPPLEVSDDKVHRWHADFPLDSVPDVEESVLPRPHVEQRKYASESFLMYVCMYVHTYVCMYVS